MLAMTAGERRGSKGKSEHTLYINMLMRDEEGRKRQARPYKQHIQRTTCTCTCSIEVQQSRLQVKHFHRQLESGGGGGGVDRVCEWVREWVSG